jgi:hypothetical protein
MILSRNPSGDHFAPQHESAKLWPYRTTPLVLPGAKVKREPGPTESYLRHHPNPAVRAPPHHLDPELLIKQKIVHKQFNSPINLYSEPNIADTIQKQTGVTPIRKQVKFNPAESETYKAIQEQQLGDVVQEVSVPPQSRIYAPNKTIPAKKSAHHVVNQNPAFSNSIGDSEVIQQSGSFKRLMWSVLPESSY